MKRKINKKTTTRLAFFIEIVIIIFSCSLFANEIDEYQEFADYSVEIIIFKYFDEDSTGNELFIQEQMILDKNNLGVIAEDLITNNLHLDNEILSNTLSYPLYEQDYELIEIPTENKILFQPVIGEITQAFNYNENHFAIDIAVDTGTPIKAVSDGRVVLAEWTMETGYVIILDHGDMLLSVYKHNSSLLKTQNELVTAGEAIALSGNQGTLTTGPHLHLELWKNGAPIDPKQFFNFK